MKEPSCHKYGGLHRQLDKIGCEMGSREGSGVESGRFTRNQRSSIAGWSSLHEAVGNPYGHLDTVFDD